MAAKPRGVFSGRRTWTAAARCRLVCTRPARRTGRAGPCRRPPSRCLRHQWLPIGRTGSRGRGTRHRKDRGAAQPAVGPALEQLACTALALASSVDATATVEGPEQDSAGVVCQRDIRPRRREPEPTVPSRVAVPRGSTSASPLSKSPRARRCSRRPQGAPVAGQPCRHAGTGRDGRAGTLGCRPPCAAIADPGLGRATPRRLLVERDDQSARVGQTVAHQCAAGRDVPLLQRYRALCFAPGQEERSHAGQQNARAAPRRGGHTLSLCSSRLPRAAAAHTCHSLTSRGKLLTHSRVYADSRCGTARTSKGERS